jgi:tetratricopeptide (TPR) repeat protein
LFEGGRLPDAPFVAAAYVGRERHGWSAVAAVVAAGWKYVRAPVPELYDLAGDPGESRSLADSLPDKAGRLSSLLDSLGGPSLSALALGAAGEELPDPKAAVADWNRIQQARLHLRHGRLYEQAGASDRALDEFDEAAAVAPELPEVHTHRGSALRHLGRMDDARRAFLRAIECDERFAPGWAGLGLVEEDTGRPDAARSAFRRALEESGGNGEVILSVLSFALRRKDLAWAVEAAERLVAVRPDDPTSLGDLATLYLEAGRVEESLATSRRAALSAPTDPRAHYNLGRALVAAGDHEEAAAAFERFLELAPDAPNAAAVRQGIEELRKRVAGT